MGLGLCVSSSFKCAQFLLDSQRYRGCPTLMRLILSDVDCYADFESVNKIFSSTPVFRKNKKVWKCRPVSAQMVEIDYFETSG